MIGTMTGKVIDFSHRSRNCKVCEYHMGRKETVPSHDCSKNWQGTSKGMEPDMALEMTHNLKDNGCPIHVLHADNDSTTTTRLKVDFKELQKKDDQNHIKKGFSKKLYDLSKTFKELKHPEVIPYLVRCFMYAIKENNDSSENIKSAFSRLVQHIFGDHTLCTDAEWCTYKNDPEKFRYKSLPNGESLSNDALKKEISTLMEKYSTRAGTLQNMGSTQGNENFNQIVASKAPKSRFYGGSSSLSNRLSASVLQKNEGYTWLSKVNEASLLSPGQHTLRIENRLKEFHLFSTFSACAKGFIDTLKVSKRVIPKHEVENYKQQTLVKEILQSTYSAHNAKEDVLSLKKLFEVKQEKCINEDVYNLNYNHAKISFKPLIDMKIINTLICSKLARGGVHLCHFKIANARDENGVKAILTENHVSAKYAGPIIQFLTVPEE
ncbi:unnamed protein product [Mytilus coruscus]|uniref:Mutator-like transposase domain-containing protein n=1 Tax=Mytilus coruscus TaxID=42192 RepID=A0A6J8CE50_MYTCO|nr:unnamed protein product [Mytilus coruscus]